MPKIVDHLLEHEKAIAEKVNVLFTTEQQCAFYLTKTIQSIYQMDDEKVDEWLKELGEKYEVSHLDARQALVLAYSKMLIKDQLCQFHLEYWLRHYQERLIDEISAFLSGLPPHLRKDWQSQT